MLYGGFVLGSCEDAYLLGLAISMCRDLGFLLLGHLEKQCLLRDLGLLFS